jgi:hypothetical protein
MAGAADDEGFASHGGHATDPFGLLGSPFGLQVLEVSDVVYFDTVVCKHSASVIGVGWLCELGLHGCG